MKTTCNTSTEIRIPPYGLFDHPKPIDELEAFLLMPDSEDTKCEPILWP